MHQDDSKLRKVGSHIIHIHGIRVLKDFDPTTSRHPGSHTGITPMPLDNTVVTSDQIPQRIKALITEMKLLGWLLKLDPQGLMISKHSFRLIHSCLSEPWIYAGPIPQANVPVPPDHVAEVAEPPIAPARVTVPEAHIV